MDKSYEYWEIFHFNVLVKHFRRPDIRGVSRYFLKVKDKLCILHPLSQRNLISESLSFSRDNSFYTREYCSGLHIGCHKRMSSLIGTQRKKGFYSRSSFSASWPAIWITRSGRTCGIGVVVVEKDALMNLGQTPVGKSVNRLPGLDSGRDKSLASQSKWPYFC